MLQAWNDHITASDFIYDKTLQSTGRAPPREEIRKIHENDGSMTENKRPFKLGYNNTTQKEKFIIKILGFIQKDYYFQNNNRNIFFWTCIFSHPSLLI